MSSRSPSHHPAGLVLLLAVAAALFGFGAGTAGCVNGKLMPAAEQGILAAFDIACPFEAAIPVPGAPAAAAACPGEDAGFKALLDQETAQPDAPDAGAPMPLLRRGGPGERALVHAGWAQPGAAADALQRKMLAAPPKPKPAPAASSSSSSSTPSIADAGAEGGR